MILSYAPPSLDFQRILTSQTFSLLYSTRWLPGFALVPYYAPSPCHMHPGHNCCHIKSCHPPDKQYTEFIIDTCSLVFICRRLITKYQWQGPHCGMVCEYCILVSAFLRIHPLKFPSLAPSLYALPHVTISSTISSTMRALTLSSQR